MGYFDFPENPEWSEKVRKLETTDKAHADVFNDVLQAVLNHIVYLKEEQKHIDGGYFTDDITVEVHDATPTSHATMRVDGGSVALMNGIISTSLEEHLADENAHPNIILDGNINE